MKYYIYRNYTVEYLFSGIDAGYSGYGEISVVDETADNYIFFYYSKINFNGSNTEEFQDYYEKITYLLSKIPADKMFFIFTIENSYCYNLIESDQSNEKEIGLFNQKIYELEKQYSNVKTVDIKSFMRNYSKKEIIDWKYFYMYQIIINPKYSKEFNNWFNKRVEKISMKRKKGVILDLDNTIWGGVIGEDGVSGIKLGGEYPGNVYVEFQKMLLNLKKSGIILAICSKNNFSDISEVFQNHQDMVLKLEDFAVLKINWENKADNVREIIEELNIGPESLVFIDDNIFERDLVKKSLPEIVVPDFPEEEYKITDYFAEIFSENFGIYEITEEDREKTEQYIKKNKTMEIQNKYSDYNDFIKELSIKIKYIQMNKYNQKRIFQLLQKTNQFNLTSKRYLENELLNLAQNEYLITCISVEDKFGDNGITGVSIVKIESDRLSADIEAFLLSCRIIGRGIENIYLKVLLNKLYSMGIRTVFAQYIKSNKNAQTEYFYEKNGFTLIEKSEELKKYKLILCSSYEIDKMYTVEICDK